MRWYRRLCTDRLAFILQLSTLVNLSYEIVGEGCAPSHRLKWGPISPNEIGRIAQHVSPKGKGTKEGKDGWE